MVGESSVTYDVKPIYRVLEWRKMRRPVGWIAREEGLTLSDVKAILRVATGENVHTELTAERYDELAYWVNQGASLSLTARETGCDSRTIKRWFPHAGLRQGGGGEAAMIRQVNQDLERIDKHGNISTRRQRE